MTNRIALTVDVEPDWGVRGTRALQEITPRFLRFLEQRQIRATFFVVSDLMDASSDLVCALGQRNEVASHGRTHRMLDALDLREAEGELKESRQRLQQTGAPVEGFRAPFFRRCNGFFGLLQAAGYRYDASMGTVMPGPVNRRLDALPCPFERDYTYEFPTSAMAAGMLPLSLTWLRLCAPLARHVLPRSPSLVYLHLHEFLRAETASCLPLPLRRLLTRNCGEPAWRILDEALEALDAEFTTCSDILRASCAKPKRQKLQVEPDGCS